MPRLGFGKLRALVPHTRIKHSLANETGLRKGELPISWALKGNVVLPQLECILITKLLIT
jgi:hypothetical protein